KYLFLSLALPAVFLLACAGCGGAAKPVNVEGIVTLDGKTLEGANVTFMPVGEGRPASGSTNAEGRFRLTTFSTNDGALRGEYRVVVTLSKDLPAQADPNAGDDDFQNKG